VDNSPCATCELSRNAYQACFSNAELVLLEHDFQAINKEASSILHTKLAKRLQPIFGSIHKAGAEIHNER
jgi:hypothetical protein